MLKISSKYLINNKICTTQINFTMSCFTRIIQLKIVYNYQPKTCIARMKSRITILTLHTKICLFLLFLYRFYWVIFWIVAWVKLIAFIFWFYYFRVICNTVQVHKCLVLVTFLYLKTVVLWVLQLQVLIQTTFRAT